MTYVLALLAAEPGSDLIINPWAQLGATGGLVIMMAVAVRVLYKSQAATIADLLKSRDKAYADLEALNKELRTAVMPTLAQVARALERLVDAQSRDRG